MEDAFIGTTPVAFGGCFGWLHQAGRAGAVAAWCSARLRPMRRSEPTRVGAGTRGSSRRRGAADATLRLSRLRRFAGRRRRARRDRSRDLFDTRGTEFLREQTGVAEVALIGLRLGAAFALEAALADNVVDSLALVTPVFRGKSFLLEQKALAKVIAARGGANTTEDFSADRFSIEGFEFDCDAIDAIMKIDLQSAARRPARRILIVGEPGSGRYEAFAEKAEIARLRGRAFAIVRGGRVAAVGHSNARSAGGHQIHRRLGARGSPDGTGPRGRRHARN